MPPASWSATTRGRADGASPRCAAVGPPSKLAAVEGQRDFFWSVSTRQIGINVPFTEADASAVTDGGARKMHARAKARRRAKNRAVWNADERESCAERKNGIVAQFILNQMNEISDHEGSLPDFLLQLMNAGNGKSLFHKNFITFSCAFWYTIKTGCRRLAAEQKRK